MTYTLIVMSLPKKVQTNDGPITNVLIGKHEYSPNPTETLIIKCTILDRPIIHFTYVDFMIYSGFTNHFVHLVGS